MALTPSIQHLHHHTEQTQPLWLIVLIYWPCWSWPWIEMEPNTKQLSSRIIQRPNGRFVSTEFFQFGPSSIFRQIILSQPGPEQNSRKKAWGIWLSSWWQSKQVRFTFQGSYTSLRTQSDPRSLPNLPLNTKLPEPSLLFHPCFLYPFLVLWSFLSLLVQNTGEAGSRVSQFSSGS